MMIVPRDPAPILPYRQPPPPIQRLYLYGGVTLTLGLLSVLLLAFVLIVRPARHDPDWKIVIGGVCMIVMPLTSTIGAIAGALGLFRHVTRGPQTIIGVLLNVGCLLALAWYLLRA